MTISTQPGFQISKKTKPEPSLSSIIKVAIVSTGAILAGKGEAAVVSCHGNPNGLPLYPAPEIRVPGGIYCSARAREFGSVETCFVNSGFKIYGVPTIKQFNDAIAADLKTVGLSVKKDKSNDDVTVTCKYASDSFMKSFKDYYNCVSGIQYGSDMNTLAQSKPDKSKICLDKYLMGYYSDCTSGKIKIFDRSCYLETSTGTYLYDLGHLRKLSKRSLSQCLPDKLTSRTSVISGFKQKDHQKLKMILNTYSISDASFAKQCSAEDSRINDWAVIYSLFAEALKPDSMPPFSTPELCLKQTGKA